MLRNEPRAGEAFDDCGRRARLERSGCCKGCELADRDARSGLAFEFVHWLEKWFISADQRRGLPRQFAEQVRGLLVALERAQDVETHHVAGTFPDRVDRSFAIEPRQYTLLDVTVAAEALHRFIDKTRRGLADPVFGRRRNEARIGRFA